MPIKKFQHEDSVVFLGTSMHRPGDSEKLIRACQMISVWRGKPTEFMNLYGPIRDAFIKETGKYLTSIPFVIVDDPASPYRGRPLQAYMLGVDAVLLVKTKARRKAARSQAVLFPVMDSELEMYTQRGITAHLR